MISVILPVYNGGAFLEACIRSILKQSESDLELLIVDDGSTDNSSRICRKFCSRDPRVRLFSQKNAGVSAARNRALEEAKGTYITFVDADDLLPPEALETLRRGMREDLDLIIGSHEYFREWERRPVIHEPQELPLPFGQEPKHPERLMSLMCGKLYRRTLIEEKQLRFRVGLPYGEDTLFNLDYCCAAGRLAVVPEVVYRCRMGGSASACRYYPDRDRIALTLIDAYCRHYGGPEAVPPMILSGLIRRELQETAIHYLVHTTLRETQCRMDRLLGQLSTGETPMEGKTFVRKVQKSSCRRILLRKLRKQIQRLHYENRHPYPL